MEDDEDIHSHQSAGSGSRSGSRDSQRSNPRITVTVASAAPPQNTLTLALPIQQPRTVGSGGGAGSGGGGGREDCWSEGATAVLIEAWGERYVELSRGNLKQKHWKEVADIVSSREDYLKAPKTDIQCKNRIDTVKKKYKLEKAKIAAGGGLSTWSFYERLDELIGPIASAKSNLASATPPLRSVPVGIPVGVRSAPVQSLRLKQQQERQQQQQLLLLQQQQQQQQLQQEQLKLQQQRKRMRPPPAYPESSESEPEPDSPESDPYEKRARIPFNARSSLNPNPRFQIQHQQKKGRVLREKNWGDSVRELTKAIMKFGEAYEHAESSKLQQMVEMQKQSMKFAKELELQRMQFFMKTQLELSQLKQSRRNAENNNSNHNHNHHSSNHNTINNNNHSDDSNN
ncbi:trihelix transcription factor ASIL2-like [Bidens hawaiensis]|uniref:trihelix transcription factor ASIL2-like n=1 Tax=Bidens hawaiensis TaxID=980011 RepID=UPI0040493C39